MAARVERVKEEKMWGARPYYCTECPLSFPTPEGLGEHLPVHNTDSTPSLSFADVAPADRALWKAEFPKACPLCPKQILGPPGWLNHMRWHQREQVKAERSA